MGKNPSSLKIFAGLALGLGLASVFLIWLVSREPRAGGDFELVSDKGPWSLSQHRKPLTLLYVGYAKCPDVCPLTLSHIASAFRKLDPSELEKIQMVFVSVDADNETAADVAVYARQFFPSFIGLTGSRASLDRTVNEFGASYVIEKDPKSYLGYSIAHTDRVFYLNTQGEVLDSVNTPRSPQPLLQKIREYL